MIERIVDTVAHAADSVPKGVAVVLRFGSLVAWEWQHLQKSALPLQPTTSDTTKQASHPTARPTSRPAARPAASPAARPAAHPATGHTPPLPNPLKADKAKTHKAAPTPRQNPVPPQRTTTPSR